MSSRLTELDKSYTDFLLQPKSTQSDPLVDRDCVLLDGSCDCPKPIRDCKYLQDIEENEEEDI